MSAQWWLCYVRWDSGVRETIRTRSPRDVFMRDRCVVRAVLPEARKSVRPMAGWSAVAQVHDQPSGKRDQARGHGDAGTEGGG